MQFAKKILLSSLFVFFLSSSAHALDRTANEYHNKSDQVELPPNTRLLPNGDLFIGRIGNKTDVVLQKRFFRPIGWKWDRFIDHDGHSIRYGYVKSNAENPRGIVVIVVGLFDLIENYYENIKWLQSKGFEVWAMEWYGQGASGRAGPSTIKVGSENYIKQAGNLSHLVKYIIKQPDMPTILFAHSMGGNIAVRTLVEFPGVFDAAFLISPMLDIRAFAELNDFVNKFLDDYGIQVVKAAIRLGIGSEYIKGVNPVGQYLPNTDEEVLLMEDTSDLDRAYIDIIHKHMHPELIVAGPTYNWVYWAFASIYEINRIGYLEQIDIPIKMLVGLNDNARGASINQIKNACNNRIKQCNLALIEGAQHNLPREADIYRDQMLRAFEEFTEQHLPYPNPKIKN